jgi:hypothetical protein
MRPPVTTWGENDHIRQTPQITRRRYLLIKVLETMEEDAPWPMAVEAVASVALEHPEIDYDEEKTWKEWEAMG